MGELTCVKGPADEELAVGTQDHVGVVDGERLAHLVATRLVVGGVQQEAVGIGVVADPHGAVSFAVGVGPVGTGVRVSGDDFTKTVAQVERRARVAHIGDGWLPTVVPDAQLPKQADGEGGGATATGRDGAGVALTTEHSGPHGVQIAYTTVAGHPRCVPVEGRGRTIETAHPQAIGGGDGVAATGPVWERREATGVHGHHLPRIACGVQGCLTDTGVLKEPRHVHRGPAHVTGNLTVLVKSHRVLREVGVRLANLRARPSGLRQ